MAKLKKKGTIHCQICGRLLRTPRSRELGMGQVCAARLMEKRERDAQMDLFENKEKEK